MTAPLRHNVQLTFSISAQIPKQLQQWHTSRNQINPTDETKTPCLDSTLSQELSSFKLLPTLHDYLLAICIVNPVLALLVLAILGNNLVLVVIPKFSALRIVFNIFIFSSALIDILVGLVVQLVFVVYIAGNNQPGLLLQFSRYLYTQII